MSDLGAIFHVKKDGVQYDAHAYTTLDECPEPNLKLTYKGQQGYVKLTDKGSGDVPCYVKPKSGSAVYQVKKEYESVPTGGVYLDGVDNSFTVPNGVTVLQVTITGFANDVQYVGVTPGKTYNLLNCTVESWDEGNILLGYVTRGRYPNYIYWSEVGDTGSEPLGQSSEQFHLAWSPEINKMTPDYKDY